MAVKEGKYTAFAIQFETTTQQDIKIKDLFTISSEFKSGKSVDASCDQIWLWDSLNGNWIMYYYQGGRGSVNTGWSKAGSTDITEDTLAAGKTAFFKRAGADANLTLAGGVKGFSTSASGECAEGKYSFLAYPWPEELAIQDFTQFYANGAEPKSGKSVDASCDQIWLWDSMAGNWIMYYYQGGRGSVNTGWSKAGSTDLTTDKIPAATGFFFKRAGKAAIITFTHITK